MQYVCIRMYPRMCIDIGLTVNIQRKKMRKYESALKYAYTLIICCSF